MGSLWAVLTRYEYGRSVGDGRNPGSVDMEVRAVNVGVWAGVGVGVGVGVH
jgi:hypothetical protein